MFCSLTRLSELRSVFTVGLVTTRSSKLDPMSIYFDDFFYGCKVTSNQSYIYFTKKFTSKLSESNIQQKVNPSQLRKLHQANSYIPISKESYIYQKITSLLAKEKLYIFFFTRKTVYIQHLTTVKCKLHQSVG